MIVNQSDLDSFHQFASRSIAQRGESLSFEDLVKQWHAQQDYEATIASVRRGVEDADAGRVRDVTDVDTTIRAALGLPERRR